jgi:hypothetical protein
MSEGGISGNSEPVRVGRSIMGGEHATIDEIMLALKELAYTPNSIPGYFNSRRYKQLKGTIPS